MPPAPAFILPSQRVEPYEDVEIRIEAAVASIHASNDPYPYITAVARAYEIPVSRLHGSLEGRQSRQERPGANHKLSDDQESAVCQYLDHLDTVDTTAQLQMVSGCPNAILQYAHTGLEPAPVVSTQWAPHFLDHHTEYVICKQQCIDIDRKNAHQPERIRAWFEKYHTVCNDHNIQACDQYNFDETGFLIGIGHDQWIIT